MRSAATVALLVFVLACSSSSGGGTATNGDSGGGGRNASSGSVGGVTVQVTTAIARYMPVTIASIRGVDLLLSSSPNTCTHLSGRTFTEIAFTLPGDPLAPGTYTIITGTAGNPYPIPSSTQALADFSAVTDCMGQSASGAATSGVINVVAADGSHVVGTFDLTFAAGHVAGSFDAPVCTNDANAIQASCP